MLRSCRRSRNWTSPRIGWRCLRSRMSTLRFAQSLGRGPAANRDAGLLMGLRMPELSGLESLLAKGLWLAVADQDAALAAPGASRKET